MGSLQNSPDPTFIDCSAGICSIYCPKWCFTVFSPPPQPPDVAPGAKLPPVIIALIVILLCVFLVVSYYSFVCMYRRRRGSRNDPEALPAEWQASAYGLDDFVIKSITVFQYRKSDRLVEGTECSVCLSEFEEGENLKLLPKCCHAFHPPCIDTWLKSQASQLSCPLCRAGVNPYFPINPNSRSSATFNVSSLEVRRDQNQLVTMVEDDSQVMEVSACDAIEMKNLEEDRFRRSSISSLGSFSRDRRLLVADIARSDGEVNLVGIGFSEDGVSRGYSAASFDSTLHDRA